MPEAPPTLFTIGHSTRTLEEFIATLKAHGVAVLADVRTVPRSRRVPQFNAETLGGNLALSGIEYLPLPALTSFAKVEGTRITYPAEPSSGEAHLACRRANPSSGQ